MIRINDLDISISGLKILSIGDYFDLTTGNSPYMPSPVDGGISVRPVGLEISDIQIGRFYITQICKQHSLQIEANNNLSSFQHQESVFKDTQLPSECHFKTFSIVNNVVTILGTNYPDDLVFFDAPFHQLFPYFNSISFSVAFETWFQYKESDDSTAQIKPLLKFNWAIGCVANNTNGSWTCRESHSSMQEIRSSIVFLDPSQNCLLPCELPHLLTEVHKYKQTNKLFDPSRV